MKQHWTAEERAASSQRTKARMADPALRAKISERTKAGMAAAADTSRPELVALHRAWHGARGSVRRQFLAEILSPVCSTPASLLADPR